VLTNLGMEMGAKVAFTPVDDVLLEYLRPRTKEPLETISADPDAAYERVIRIDAGAAYGFGDNFSTEFGSSEYREAALKFSDGRANGGENNGSFHGNASGGATRLIIARCEGRCDDRRKRWNNSGGGEFFAKQSPRAARLRRRALQAERCLKARLRSFGPDRSRARRITAILVLRVIKVAKDQKEVKTQKTIS